MSTIDITFRRFWALAKHSALAMALALGVAAGAFAQDDPFGEAADPEPAGAGDDADPFTVPGSPTTKPADPKAKPGEVVVPPETDPIVLAVRRTPPETPSAAMRAVRVLMRVGRQDAALPYLQQFLGAAPDDATLAAVHAESGSAFFLQLSLDTKLQPAGREAAQAVFAAADRQAKDPARLDAAVAALGDDSSAVRARATIELLSAGTSSVTPLVRALTKSGSTRETAGENERHAAAIRAAIVGLGSAAVEPLIGSLPAVEAPHSATVVELLGLLKSARARPYLVRPYLSADSSPELRRAAELAFLRIGVRLPDGETGPSLLKTMANEFLAGQPVLRSDENDRVTLWRWNAERQASAPVTMSSSDASLQVACRLAYDLYALRPDDPDAQRLYLSTQLEAAKIVGGMDRPLPNGLGSTRELARNFGAPILEEVFYQALESKHIAAAIAVVEVLGDIGGEAALHPADDGESVLVQAMKTPYRRLQLAAAESIARIDPRSPYAGSSYFSRALGRLVRTAGERRVLIGLPNDNEAHSLAGLLLGMGYESDIGLTGAETFKRATDPEFDYEFVLLHDAVDHPAALELLQWLRRDPRTAPLPVGLLAREHRFDAMKEIASIDRLTLAFPRIHDAATAAFQIDRLIRLLGRDYVTLEERMEGAVWALDSLAKMAAAPEQYSFYDLIREQDALESALFSPELMPTAAAALGSLATPEAQRILLSAAGENIRPIEERQAAAQAFAAAVERRRVLLTSDEIMQQYDRYNASRSQDKASQAVLGTLLDAIEAPSRSNGLDPQRVDN